MAGGRRPKRLAAHIVQGTYRAVDHNRLLIAEDLPLKPPHPDPTPAMVRLWGRLREAQSEFRDVASMEVRRDLAIDFGKLATAYRAAVATSQRDPLQEISGIAEIIRVNRESRALYEREQAKRKADATD